MNDEEIEYLSFEQCAGKQKIPYPIYDSDGNKVIINPKNEINHFGTSAIEDKATVFYNLGKVVEYPTSVQESTSMNPQAIKHRQDGKVLEFRMKGYLHNLNLPDYVGDASEEAVVIIKYQDPNLFKYPKNYTLTYRIDFYR